MFLQSLGMVFPCVFQHEIQGTLASTAIEWQTSGVTRRRRTKAVKIALLEARSALDLVRLLPPARFRAEPAGWPNTCSVFNCGFHSLPLSDRARRQKSALSLCSDSSRRKQ
jgi:hypothetical protein